MELEELVTKIISHIDETTARTKNDIIREVNVLLEQQRDTIIKFVDTRASTIEDRLTVAEDRLGEQMLTTNNKITNLYKKVSDSDKEVEFQIKRVK
jgi:hypothetical protein